MTALPPCVHCAGVVDETKGDGRGWLCGRCDHWKPRVALSPGWHLWSRKDGVLRDMGRIADGEKGARHVAETSSAFVKAHHPNLGITFEAHPAGARPFAAPAEEPRGPVKAKGREPPPELSALLGKLGNR